MTADERIETLLNRAGQTISDLPKPTAEKYAYPLYRQIEAKQTVLKWFGEEADYAYTLKMSEYILHLADIIDRMECALENTLLKLQETKRAHWISREMSGLSIKVCSNCGRRKFSSFTSEPKYCEECGSRMDEEAQNEPTQV